MVCQNSSLSSTHTECNEYNYINFYTDCLFSIVGAIQVFVISQASEHISIAVSNETNTYSRESHNYKFCKGVYCNQFQPSTWQSRCGRLPYVDIITFP